MDRRTKIRLAKTPIVGRALLAVYRAQIAFASLRAPLANGLHWWWRSNEITNFTYDLDALNQRYLAALIADVLDVDPRAIERYLQELADDAPLRAHLAATTARSERGFLADTEVRFGRRIGWYAIARAIKPRVIVETGVDKGLGACLLTAALLRNRQEGCDGRYYGTDIDPGAGYLLCGEYAERGRILYGDSIRSLANLDETIDLFINDSDHSTDYEYREYLTVAGKLSKNAIVLGDNAHCSDRLLQFARETGRHFLYFQEKPVGHWYPGGGIGIAFHRRRGEPADDR